MTLSTAARNAAVNAIAALLNGGRIQFKNGGGTVVATLPLSATAFGSAASGTATANTITSDSSAAGGTAASASFQNSSNVEIFTATVGVTGSGADITAASVVVTAGETVSMTSLTMTQPTS